MLFGNEIDIAMDSKFKFKVISVKTCLFEITVATPTLAWFSFVRFLTKILECFSVGW